MQGVFPFILDAPKDGRAWGDRSERLFFAALPSGQTGHCIWTSAAQFLRDRGLDWRLHEELRLHISLHFIGDFPRLREKTVFASRLAAANVSLPPAEITFDTIRSFDGAPSKNGRPCKRPLVLLSRENGLCELHHGLGVALRKHGLRSGKHFTPHLTLAYGPTLIAAQAIEPIRMLINDFVLIHSELGRTRYNLLGRWPLRG